MATLAPQVIDRDGANPTYAAASVGGDEFANSGKEFAHIKNGGGSSITVTVDTTLTIAGLAVADRTLAIPAGESRFIGPFPPGTHNDADGHANLTYSAVASLTLAILRLDS